MLLSIIVPCYNEEEALPIFYDEMQKHKILLKNKHNLDCEFIFVNDGSKDKSSEIMKTLANKDKGVYYINFSRNFGKESAMYAGLKAAKGDYVVVMDVDLQDPPSLLKEMYEFLINNPNYSCVATRRFTRKGEPVIRSAFANAFYKLINKMTEVEIVNGARDYRMMTKSMVNSIINLSEKNRFSKGLFSWVGFKTKWLKYENIERSAGTTKWSFFKLFKYAVEGITSFTTAPLLLSFIIAFTLLFGGLITTVVSICLSSVFIGILSAFLWSSGIILLPISILCLYISKMYREIKNRPIYITEDTNIR